MKKLLVVITAIAIAAGFISCAKTAAKPSDVLSRLKEAKSEEDARAYFTKGTLKAMDEVKKLMPDVKDKKGGQSIDKNDKWEVLKEEIKGDTAVVTVKFTGSDNQKKVGTSAPIKFKKEDGSWKVDLEEEINLGLQMLKSLKGLDVNKLMKDAMKNVK